MSLNEQVGNKEKEEPFKPQDKWEYTKYEGSVENDEDEPEFDSFGTALNEL